MSDSGIRVPQSSLSQKTQYLHVQQILDSKESSCKTWGHFCTASVHSISVKKYEQKLFNKMNIQEATFLCIV